MAPLEPKDNIINKDKINKEKLLIEKLSIISLKKTNVGKSI